MSEEGRAGKGDSVDLLVRGVAGCPKSAVWRFSLLDTFSPRSDLLVRNLNLFQTRVPNLAQGQSGVFVEMPFTQLTTNPRFVEYDSGIRDLVITCGDSGSTPSLVELPPGESVFCQVAPVGGGGEPKPFPRLLDLEWRSSDSSVVTAGSGFCCEEGCGRGDPPDDCCRCGRIGAADLGAATISVVALSAGREFARSSQGVDVEVVELDLPDLPLNGIVRSEADDSPIAGARIRILDFDRSLITSTTSEADGTFSVEVRSGLVTVSVSADGFGQAEQEVEVGPLEPPLVTIVLLRTSEDTFGINGTVMELTADSARRPVDGATVTVLISPSTPIGLAVTDGDGHYELRVPPQPSPTSVGGMSGGCRRSPGQLLARGRIGCIAGRSSRL